MSSSRSGGKTLHAIFERIAAAHPDSPAVLAGESSLGFGELNSRANRLARWLREKGVGYSDPVVLGLARSPQAIVFILSCLKIGARYVPVPHGFPRERKEFVVADCQPRMIMTDRVHAGAFSDLGADIVLIEDAWRESGHLSDTDPDAEIIPEDVAWILYTSGSTGKPKGVMGTHLGTLNRIEWMWSAQPFLPGEISFQNTAFTTVDSTWEIWSPLCSGRPLRIFGEETVQDAVQLVEQLSRFDIFRITLVPSFLDTILTLFPDLGRRLPKLRLWVASGEKLTPELCLRFYSAMPDGALYNQYGMTESCADITSFDTRRLFASPDQGRSNLLPSAIPIGLPIPNVRIFILDSGLKPVSQGEEGELFVAGACLAKGYLNRPELNGSRFLDWTSENGESTRLYRSGDVCRRTRDGNLELLGRADSQVKIRGFRVELGEIESVLSAHPHVGKAAVLLREDIPGHPLLVAYISRKSGHWASLSPDSVTASLQARLSEFLPDYMVPKTFVLLEEFPLTSSGKLDRVSLPPPVLLGTAPQGPSLDMSETERWLAGYWSELLHIKGIGPGDSFISLGGHSLLAMRLLLAVQNRFSKKIPLKEFFDSPTLRSLAGMIATKPLSGTDDSLQIKRAAIEGRMPLSFSQRSMWIHSSLAENIPLYNIPFAIRLRGRLDVPALQSAFGELVRRHEVLRCALKEVSGEMQMTILEPSEFGLKIGRLDRPVDGEIESRLTAIALQKAAEPFFLATGPLFRAELFPIRDGDWLLVIRMHHIVTDGWSVRVMNRELEAYYLAFRLGKKPVLPELPIRFMDYAVWQAQWSVSGDCAEHLEYWKGKLAGAPLRLDLSGNATRPAAQSFKGGRFAFLLPSDLIESIRNLTRLSQATLYTVLLSSFHAFLHRISGQNDVLVGTPTANRISPGTEDLIGCFANTIVMRTRYSPDNSFSGFIEEVRIAILEAQEHQDLPFEMLVDAMGAGGSVDAHPIFQVLFIMQQTPEKDLNLEGLSVSYLDIENPVSKFDLSVLCEEHQGGMKIEFEYAEDLFDADRIRSMAAGWEALLRAAVVDPALPLGRLPVIGAAERTLLLTTWNATARDFPLSRTPLSLFEDRVRLHPHAPAVQCAGETLSYAELNLRADRLAAHLRRLVPGPLGLVAVCLERSLDMLVGVLAIWKAGGAYLPLDPEYPQDRLDYMLEDGQPSLLLTQSSLSVRFPLFAGVRLLLDREQALFKAGDGADGHAPALSGPETSEALCYVLYTSGSTGRPKGVQITHANLTNFLCDMGERLALGPKDVLVSVTTLSFDISGLELYLPLLCGAQVVIARREEAVDGMALVALMASVGCTLLQATPATWRLLLDAGWRRPPAFKVLCGGEALSPDLAQALMREGGSVWNLYGPTETTIWSTVAELHGEAPITLGRPLANTRLYLLDANGEPVPLGVPGEIYIGGAGVGRGYLNRPELTAERFRPDPWGLPGDRMYRTGDLASYLKDGTLKYLGRLDHQIKLRGFRIELGEIESALEGQGSVAQAVVTPQGEGDALRLVAHVVPRSEAAGVGMDLSLFFFSANASGPSQDLYGMYLESARYADEAGFKAVWTPERHFHQVGGPYPNPSVLTAALAVSTRRIALRAGSVVLPLHHPIRVAEEWSVLDNLSGGRVGVAFASGWNPKDFALSPSQYGRRREVTAEHMGTIRRLWKGETVAVTDGLGQATAVGLYPRPLQAALPMWLTASGGKETFEEAGRMGVHVLTHLLGQTVEALLEKIALYRKARLEAGHDPDTGVVTLMLHTFLWESDAEAMALSRKPFAEYLKAHVSLEKMAESVGWKESTFTKAEEEELVGAAVEKYLRHQSLIGGVEECLEKVRYLRRHGVDEIACFIDFGMERGLVMQSLAHLKALGERSREAGLMDLDRLERALRAQLPAYMVPSAYVVHAAFPKTPNGKVDRSHLAGMRPVGEMARPSGRAPATEAEVGLAALWREVLGVEVRRVEDNFFTLGGHSLLATRLVSRIRKAYGVDLRLRTLFESPTLGDLAKAIAESAPAPQSAGNALLKAKESGGNSPLSFAQSKIWKDESPDRNPVMHNKSFAWKITGSLDTDLLRKCAGALIERHPVLRSRIIQINGLPHQALHIAPVGKIIWDTVALWDDSDAIGMGEPDPGAAEEPPLSLSGDHLIRFRLFQANEDSHVLKVTRHAILVDLLSVEILIAELGKLYDSAIHGRPLLLEEPGAVFADFAIWQRQRVNTPEGREERDFWKNYLKGVRWSTPWSSVRRPIREFRGSELHFTIPTEIAAGVRNLCETGGYSLFSTLLAAFNLAIHARSGALDMVIGTPSENRSRQEWENVVGLIANVVPIRTKVDPGTTVREFLVTVRKQAETALSNQEYPFEGIVEDSGIPFQESGEPLCPILFVLHRKSESHGWPARLEVQSIDQPLTAAKYDMVLGITEHDGGLEGAIEFRGDLMDQNEAAQWARDWMRALKEMIRGADLGLGLAALSIVDSVQDEGQVQAGLETMEKKWEMP